MPPLRLVLCGDVCLAVPLKTGVNLNLAICVTDVLLCPQLRSWGCRPRASGSSGLPDHLITWEGSQDKPRALRRLPRARALHSAYDHQTDLYKVL